MNLWQRLATFDGRVSAEVYRDRGASPAVAPEALAATVRTLAFASAPFGWSFLISCRGSNIRSR